MIKRLFDIIFSLIGLILLSPILFIISVAIVIDSGLPIIYTQERVGKNRIPFKLFKFRSMRAESKGLKITVANDNRITTVGRFIRKYKMDEFPQFINILKGEMSFVGPRPELERYVNQYSKEQLMVLNTKPGLTGLDSLNFTKESELLKGKENPETFYIEHIMPIKLKYNLTYMHKKSLWFDIKIIIKTIGKIIS